ncbi:MAG: OmpH family outer membrane protein [Alphaproteobacteria bacterium]|nr:OmpH family outer membrane protein [Alphaproteobacteria bacterium]
MKKNVLLLIVVAGLTMGFNRAHAQTHRIGYFNDQAVLSLYPGISGKLDTALQNYNRDTLQEEYYYTLRQYTLKDSNYRLDSANMRPIQRELEQADISKLRYKLVNWQQYQQQVLQQKQEEFLKPFLEKIVAALNEVVQQEKFTYVFKEESLSPYVQPPLEDNLTIPVALKLKLEIPKDALEAYQRAKASKIKPSSTGTNTTKHPN